jgi:hypothetical protein
MVRKALHLELTRNQVTALSACRIVQNIEYHACGLRMGPGSCGAQLGLLYQQVKPSVSTTIPRSPLAAKVTDGRLRET